VKLASNGANVGFARGVNPGLAATTAPYVLVMNPDCRLMAGAIRALQSVLEAHPQCAIVGPRILNPDGTVQGSARGDPNMLTGLFGRTTLLRRVVPFLPVAKRNIVVEEAIRSGSDSVVVDWLSGACMLARRTRSPTVKGSTSGFFCTGRTRISADGCAIAATTSVCAGCDGHPSRWPIESHGALVCDPRLPHERVFVLRDACRAGAAQPQAGDRACVAAHAVHGAAHGGVAALGQHFIYQPRDVFADAINIRSIPVTQCPLPAPGAGFLYLWRSESPSRTFPADAASDGCRCRRAAGRTSAARV
jgi:hypothetical protein